MALIQDGDAVTRLLGQRMADAFVARYEAAFAEGRMRSLAEKLGFTVPSTPISAEWAPKLSAQAMDALTKPRFTAEQQDDASALANYCSTYPALKEAARRADNLLTGYVRQRFDTVITRGAAREANKQAAELIGKAMGYAYGQADYLGGNHAPRELMERLKQGLEGVESPVTLHDALGIDRQRLLSLQVANDYGGQSF